MSREGGAPRIKRTMMLEPISVEKMRFCIYYIIRKLKASSMCVPVGMWMCVCAFEA